MSAHLLQYCGADLAAVTSRPAENRSPAADASSTCRMRNCGPLRITCQPWSALLPWSFRNPPR